MSELSLAEGGRVGVSDMRGWMGHVVWLAAALCAYVNYILFLQYGLLPWRCLRRSAA